MLRRSDAEAKYEENSTAQRLTNYASRWGYACHDMAKDDNCFYHAISHQLRQQLGIFIPYDKLRAIAVEHVLNHLTLYNGSVSQSMHTFIDKMSQNSEWADEIHLRALSRALNLSVVIVRSDEAVTVLRREKPNALLHLGYEVGVHYQSLTVQTPDLCEKLQQERVDNAEADTGFSAGLSLEALKKLGQSVPVLPVSDTKKMPSVSIPKLDMLPKDLDKEDKKQQPPTTVYSPRLFAPAPISSSHAQLLPTFQRKLHQLCKDNNYTFRIKRPQPDQLVIQFTAVNSIRVLAEPEDIRKELVTLTGIFQTFISDSGITIKPDQYNADLKQWKLTIQAEPFILDQAANLLHAASLAYLPPDAKTGIGFFQSPGTDSHSPPSSTSDSDVSETTCAIQ